MFARYNNALAADSKTLRLKISVMIRTLSDYPMVGDDEWDIIEGLLEKEVKHGSAERGIASILRTI